MYQRNKKTRQRPVKDQSRKDKTGHGKRQDEDTTRDKTMTRQETRQRYDKTREKDEDKTRQHQDEDKIRTETR